MQNRRVGIIDIAEATHVSAGTVHRALNGKAGVGEATRKRILETAKAMGYQPNINASLLKRKPLRIAGAFPAYTEQNRYYYPYVWQGFRECMEEMADYNIETVEVPYGIGRGMGSQREELLALWERDQVDGLITIGHLAPKDSAVLKKFTEKGIPVMLACDDMPGVERLCCVQADHIMTGRMVAELLSGQIPPDSQVLICAGDVDVPSHYQTVQGLESFAREAGLGWNLVKVYGNDNDTQAVSARVEALLEEMPQIRAAYSVNARNSQVLCQAAVKLGRTGTLRIVTSDIFPENVQALKAGLCHNIAFKNPRLQAYQAARLLLDFLLKRQKPLEEVQYVNSEIVFRSNVHVYECM